MIPGIVAQASMGEAAPRDPYFANVVLLVGGAGADGSAAFVDESDLGHGLTAAGGVVMDTDAPLFGKPSILFDGDARIVAADSDDWHMGTGDWTFECWAKFSIVAGGIQALVSQYSGIDGHRQFILRGLSTNAPGDFVMSYYPGGTTSSSQIVANYNWTPTTTHWYHLAYDRASDVHRLYIDGAMVAKSTNSVNAFNATEPLYIGNFESGGFNNGFHGNMAEIRLTKGVARFASDAGYDVPSAAYPRN